MPGGANQWLDAVHCEVGLPPPPMEPAEAPAEVTITITNLYLFPSGLPALDANDPEGKSEPSPHATYPRPLPSSEPYVCPFSLQIKTALSTMVRMEVSLCFFPVLCIILCQWSTQGWLAVHSDPGASIGKGLNWITEHPGR